nr:MAG TPA: hypothetical protein [Bacteriophage sp.]
MIGKDTKPCWNTVLLFLVVGFFLSPRPTAFPCRFLIYNIYSIYIYLLYMYMVYIFNILSVYLIYYQCIYIIFIIIWCICI